MGGHYVPEFFWTFGRFYLFLLLVGNIICQVIGNEIEAQAPRIITQPSATGSGLVSEGRTKILQCQALGHPQPEYRWIKDGSYLGPFTSEHFYKIQASTRNDSGDYQCIVRNSAGAILSEKIRVTVAFMTPFDETDEKTVIVRAGEAAVLDLPRLQTFPPPSVSWQARDNSLLYGSKYATTLDFRQVILDVNSADQKAYRARATNTQLGQDELSAYIQLIVTNRDGIIPDQIPPSIIISPTDTQVTKGQPEVELQCIANARPLHELETIWLKDGVPIESAGISMSFNDLYNRTLSLLKVSSRHGGQYSCRARLRNSGFPIQSVTAKISIVEKPHFVTPMPAESLGEFGREIQIRCDVGGVPQPNVTWYKDTVKVDGLPGYTVDSDTKTLTVQYLRAQDSGIYQCWATNIAGEANGYTWLRVKTTAPIMLKSPENRTVLEGNDVTLFCEVGGAPLPNTTWYKNETEEICSGGRFQILETGSLLIAAVRSRDVGQYTCIRSNSAGTVIGSAHIGVLVRTQIVQPPVDTQVILGQVATLQCKVSSDPAIPYEIEWEHDNDIIVPGASTRILIETDGTLEIREVRATDVGQYKCLIRSDGGHDERTAQLKIIELPFPPTNAHAKRLETLMPGANSKPVNLTWSSGFDGNSVIIKYIIQKRTITTDAGNAIVASNADFIPSAWETLYANVSSEMRQVLIEGLKPAASYQFRISSVNAVGEGEASAPSNVVTLPQEAPSGPPVGLVGSARSFSEIIIQWHPPMEEHKNGNILGYVIRYRLQGYGDTPWSIRNITNEAQRNYLIQDLITWKDYEIQIAAYNNKGIGIFSPGIKIKTREGVPNAPPTNVQVAAINSTCVRVTWKPPDPQQINGINQGYKIQAWLNESLSQTTPVPPSPFDPLAIQTGVICDLEKFTTYNLTVLCFTNPGDGRKSLGVQVQTLEDTPDAVGNFHFEEISDRAVRVVWTPPIKPNGILVGYTLRYGMRDSSLTFATINFTANTTNIKVTDLKANTYYTFEVFAMTVKGRGVSKSGSIKSGVEPVLPNPPINLAVSNIQPFSVVLQFKPGFDGNSSIAKWTVEAQTYRNATWAAIFDYCIDPESSIVSPGGTTTSTTTAPVSSNMESIVVLKLQPFSQYKLRLIANNVVGPSVPSEPSQSFQTLQAAPANPPRNVTVRAMSATQLKVRWIPLQQSEWYGNPRGYNISYRPVGSHRTMDSEMIVNPTGNAYILNQLEEFTQYEIVMSAVNDVGTSVPSVASMERTREAVPGAGPAIVEANATSSTTIVVQWGTVPETQANGVIEGFKVSYGGKNVPFRYKQISSNLTFKTTLTELKKFTQYHIQVLAYTRVGDGALSEPPILVQTWDDVPGRVANVSFPDVSTTMTRMIWDPPADPNGVILAYKITYALEGFTSASFAMDFPPETRTFRATDLEREKNYWFSICAKTRLGWGDVARLLVFTTNNRELPQAPSAPRISPSQIQSRQITFSWTSGRDGFGPIRYYTVEYQEGDGHWQRIGEQVSPSGSSYTAKNLKPYTSYKFRIQATNDIGPSGFSPESNVSWTLPAAPSGTVGDIQIIPTTTTSVRVNWKPMPIERWNGDAETGGYYVVYRQMIDYPVATAQASPNEEVGGIQSSTVLLKDLVKDKNYEISVIPFNSRGESERSRPVTVYVGEAVPTGEPKDVSITAVSSTEIQIQWLPPLKQEQNGDLLGYKLYYKGEGVEEELEVIPAWCTKHSLFFLEMYTWYSVRMAAFNPAGDGPFTPPTMVRTHQGPPGPVTNISFHDITMTSLKVTWSKPPKPNGEIAHYLVTYETIVDQGSSGEDQVISKQVRQKVSCCSLLAENLEEETRYRFSIRAKNIILSEVGPPEWKNVTTGPQVGSPGTPRSLRLNKMYGAVSFHWVNDEKSKISGYYVEAKRRVAHEWEMHDNRWVTVHKMDDGAQTEFTLSFQHLLPSNTYTFRLIAYNQFGISYPIASDEIVQTPSKLYLDYGYLQDSRFYKQTWFLVVVASVVIIFILGIVAYLCVKTKSYKYKHENERSIEETTSIEDGGVMYGSSVELRHSQKKISTLKRKGQGVTRVPPRPTPGSVTYTDDESDKAYDNNPDESSLTEKPSEISSTDSQGSETDMEDDIDGRMGGLGHYPHSFVNHYANVNDTLKQSWQRQKPVRTAMPQVSYATYTEAEPEATSSLQGGQGRVVLENMARSRKPLPGFSSFI